MTTTKGKASGSPAGGSGKATSIGAPHGEVVIYEDPAHGVRVDVRLEQDTLWLNLNQIAELFGRDKSVISRHLRNVFREGELDRESTVAKFATVQQEGGRTVTRQIEHFNLDAILSVGYRVNSKRGTQFRIWATQVLRDHLLRGYTVNARRLEQLRHVDGNKRIGAALFLRFLDKNGALIGADGEPAISQEGLVAVTLLIAESEAADRDVLIRVLIALLRKNRAGMGERR